MGYCILCRTLHTVYYAEHFTLQLMWELKWTYTLALYQSRSRSHISSLRLGHDRLHPCTASIANNKDLRFCMFFRVPAKLWTLVIQIITFCRFQTTRQNDDTLNEISKKIFSNLYGSSCDLLVTSSL